MKIYQINGGVFGSTGKIMFGISEVARKAGHETRCASPITKTNRHAQPAEPYVRVGGYYGRCISVLLGRMTGLEGCFSMIATGKLIKDIKSFDPDVLHLHNIHNSFVNLPMLFRFIKRQKVRVVWTLHDCWSFTGHCPHFDMIGCDQWREACCRCPQYKDYPKSWVDNARMMHRKKKKWFTGVQNMTIITPSQWLADLAEQSFLNQYPIRVVHNGIDLSIFRPIESTFRKEHHLEDKFLILGVAFGWSYRKGLDVFIELAHRLDERYGIVLVGTDEAVDQQLPCNVISIHRTKNQVQLAEIYSAADVLINPTREDTFPTVNLESLACGTPVLTFNTGGSPECIDHNCGSIVNKNDVDALLREIERIREERPYNSEAIRSKASEFEKHAKFQEIIQIYEE